jgi:hypothetical protein
MYVSNLKNVGNFSKSSGYKLLPEYSWKLENRESAWDRIKAEFEKMRMHKNV